MYRCKSIMDTGAIVTWSCDNTSFGYFECWNPMLGFEVGMTREITKQTKVPADEIDIYGKFPSEKEALTIEQMILGYTINGAYQLGLDNTKGSISIGKDADYQIYEQDLFNIPSFSFSHISPIEVNFLCEQSLFKKLNLTN